MLTDREIAHLIEDGVLTNADPSRLGPVSYDLRTCGFYRDEEKLEEVVLSCGESVFVGAVEGIALPNDLTCEVGLKNSRITQGLSIDAPLYFPGHATRLFFRVTNVCADEIRLTPASDLAQATFERLPAALAVAYSGAPNEESDSVGVGEYRQVYATEATEIERETEGGKIAKRKSIGINVGVFIVSLIALVITVDISLSWWFGQVDRSSFIIVCMSVMAATSALDVLTTYLCGPSRYKILTSVSAAITLAAAVLVAITCYPVSHRPRSARGEYPVVVA